MEVLQQRSGTPILVLWDNLRAHHAAEKAYKATAKHPDRIEFAYFPPYTPWLDPVESVFCRIKTHDMAQFCPHSHQELDAVSSHCFAAIRSDKIFLKSCFRHAGLSF